MSGGKRVNQNKHTQGPWAFNPSIDNTESYHGYHIGPPCMKGVAMDHQIDPIAYTSNSRFTVSSEECLANAQLIAAAPEMLAALEKLTTLAASQLDQSATHDGLENCKALADARRAIAKAAEANGFLPTTKPV